MLETLERTGAPLGRGGAKTWSYTLAELVREKISTLSHLGHMLEELC